MCGKNFWGGYEFINKTVEKKSTQPRMLYLEAHFGGPGEVLICS